jgi:ketosteroid isomerase-like protein
MGKIVDTMLSVLNAHDLDGFVSLFAPDYRSEQPAHPNRAFTGSDQVRENWSGVFSGIPDFRAELVLTTTTDDGVEISEWRWSGTHTDGGAFEMRGVTVLGIENERIAWGRLYMEPLEQNGADIDEMVQETYRPPPDR